MASFFLEITMILGQKVGNRRLISNEDFFFLEITMILGQKVKNRRLISNEDLFFSDHYDFGTKIEVFYLFGPTVFLISENGPRLKKVQRSCIKVSRNGETESRYW